MGNGGNLWRAIIAFEKIIEVAGSDIKATLHQTGTEFRTAGNILLDTIFLMIKKEVTVNVLYFFWTTNNRII